MVVDTSLLPFAYLLPLGLLLAAWGSVPTPRLRESALAALVTVIAAVVAYLGFGFALQFGGVGLGPGAPGGLAGLDQAWSPFPAAAGQWTFAGIEGFFVSAQGEAGSLALVETLALHRLPLAIAAGLIPVVALGDRVHRVAAIAAGIVSSAIVFPIAGSWMWGGGWLAALGLRLNLGHGAIDPAGSGVAFFAPACAAFVALRLFRSQGGASTEEPILPISQQPLLAMLGAILFGAGWSAWLLSDPLLGDFTAIGFEGVIAAGLLSAVTASIVTSAYTWLATGRVHIQMAVRGWIAGWIAVGASAGFVPTASAIVIGLMAGSLFVAAQYAIERSRGLDDRAGAVAVYGAAGAWGLIAVGLFADGAFGAGWNGVTVSQGVRGILAADPGQLTAQYAALIATGLFALGAAALLLSPFTIVARRSPSAINPPAAPTVADAAEQSATTVPE
jgi:Amt family ammonium transporter